MEGLVHGKSGVESRANMTSYWCRPITLQRCCCRRGIPVSIRDCKNLVYCESENGAELDRRGNPRWFPSELYLMKKSFFGLLCFCAFVLLCFCAFVLFIFFGLTFVSLIFDAFGIPRVSEEIL
jgi:hypothetical protein